MIPFIGDRIQNVLETKGISNRDAYQRIGVTKSAWSMYLNNQRTPPTETIRRIAEEFEVSTDYLLGLKNME